MPGFRETGEMLTTQIYLFSKHPHACLDLHSDWSELPIATSRGYQFILRMTYFVCVCPGWGVGGWWLLMRCDDDVDDEVTAITLQL